MDVDFSHLDVTARHLSTNVWNDVADAVVQAIANGTADDLATVHQQIVRLQVRMQRDNRRASETHLWTFYSSMFTVIEADQRRRKATRK